jgi:RNA-directed DNA polymerase
LKSKVIGYNESLEGLANDENGTPQGGILSPTLANFTLNGLESVVYKAVRQISTSTYQRSKRFRVSRKVIYLLVNVVRFADDFVITARSKHIIKTSIRPAVNEFLSQRGLALSTEKTKILSLDDGFNFLGYTFKRRAN